MKEGKEYLHSNISRYKSVMRFGGGSMELDGGTLHDALPTVSRGMLEDSGDMGYAWVRLGAIAFNSRREMDKPWRNSAVTPCTQPCWKSEWPGLVRRMWLGMLYFQITGCSPVIAFFGDRRQKTGRLLEGVCTVGSPASL